jgi:hypothetical protein
MKKVLLAGTALLGLAAVSAPAQAEINLDLGGYFRGYGVFADSDEVGTAGASDDLRQFDFRRDAEVHFTGEAVADNGLTVGVHAEVALGGNSSVFNDGNGDGAIDAGETITEGESLVDEVYMYLSGNWGRVNFGSEDGAAYLLQVGAPSADSNVDGLRTQIQAINTELFTDALAGGVFNAGGTFTLDYDNADFENTDRLTYLTPKWNGFQAGVSYAPEVGQNRIGNNTAGMEFEDDAGQFEDLWEIGARYDGEFEGFGVSVGGGYAHASAEGTVGVGGLAAGDLGSDDLETWNAGLNVSFQAFSVGAAYLDTNNGAGGVGIDADTDTWVVGAAWDNGPYHLGATWMDAEAEEDVFGSNGDAELDRLTLGGAYTYGPGMSFRGAVAFGSGEETVGADTDEDFTQVTVGTDIQF